MQVLAAIVPESFHKFDRFGMPAYWMKAGRVNPELLLKYVTVDDMVQTHLWGQEYSFARAEEKSRELGRNIDQFVNVVDLQGLTMAHRSCLKYMRTIAALDASVYPESLGKTYIINAPWIFPALWKLIRGSLDPVTADKIVVLGHDYKDVLRERFDPADLPAEYGGSCHCEGGCIPEYTEAQALRVVEEVERKLSLDELTLTAGQQHVVRLDTGVWGGTVQVYFKSLKSDVGFQAVFTPKQPSASAPHPNKNRRKSSTSDAAALMRSSAAVDPSTSSSSSSSSSAAAASSASAPSPSSSMRECPYAEAVWQEHARFVPQQPHKMRFVTDYAGVAVLTFDNRHSWRHAETFRFKVTLTEGKEGVRKEGMARFTAHANGSAEDDGEEPTH